MYSSAYRRALSTFRSLSFGTVLLLLVVSTSAQAQDQPVSFDDATAAPVGSEATRAFAKGTWTLQSFVSAVAGDDDHGHMVAGHIGFGYHVIDNVSINVEGFGGWVDSKVDDDGGLGGFDLLLRWHFLSGESGSLFAEGGVGFQLATTNFPSDSHHNFRPQLGIGGTLKLADTLRLLAGVRYLHVSNAATTENNDGGDWAMFYLGLIKLF